MVSTMLIGEDKKKQDLGSNDLSLKLDLAGFKKHVTPESHICNSTIAQGSLQFSSSNTGVHIHTCDLVEKRNFSSTAELDACLSINILLKGRVKYQLGQHSYEFSTNNKQPVVIVNAINQSEIFTRFMTLNQHVRKINISCDKNWLFERCITPNDKNLLQNIFSHNKQVTSWVASQSLIELANTLIDNVEDKSLNNQLLSERIAFEVLQCAIKKLKQLSNNEQRAQLTPLIPQEQNNLLNQVNSLLEQKLSLQEVANELAMSISTLQRKFKAQYNVTVKEYYRKKKLNQSRKHLIIDGLSIGETAYLAGYKHTSNFNHAFKQEFNLTPSEFLHQHQR